MKKGKNQISPKQFELNINTCGVNMELVRLSAQVAYS